MKVCAQTLVLFDNSGSVSETNRQIEKEIVKYMFKNTDGSRAYCLASYDHEMTDEEEYTMDYTELCIEAEKMEYSDKEKSLVDVLTAVLSKWEEADYACRDIVILTDGMDSDSLYYEREELFYTINNTSYPIYIVDLEQEDNVTARKNLSAIAKTSGGKLFETEFEGSEGGVDEKISRAIFKEMDSYAKANWGVYEEDDTGEDVKEEVKEEVQDESVESGDNSEIDKIDETLESEMPKEVDEKEEVIEDEILMEEYLTRAHEENVIYDKSAPQTNYDLYFGVGIAFVAVCILIIMGMLVFKKKKENSKEDKEYEELVERKVKERKNINERRPLNDLFEEDNECETRLLYVSEKGKDITFEDVNDPSRYYALKITDSITVGRSAGSCDVVIDYDDSVSLNHCEILIEDEKFYIKDNNSSNGTTLNGTRIYKKTPIYCGDMIGLGAATLIVRF